MQAVTSVWCGPCRPPSACSLRSFNSTGSLAPSAYCAFLHNRTRTTWRWCEAPLASSQTRGGLRRRRPHLVCHAWPSVRRQLVRSPCRRGPTRSSVRIAPCWPGQCGNAFSMAAKKAARPNCGTAEQASEWQATSVRGFQAWPRKGQDFRRCRLKNAKLVKIRHGYFRKQLLACMSTLWCTATTP